MWHPKKVPVVLLVIDQFSQGSKCKGTQEIIELFGNHTDVTKFEETYILMLSLVFSSKPLVWGW